MIHQVLDKIYKIELPIPFPLKTINVYFIDDSPRTLVDAGIKTEASFETLKKGLETIGVGLNSIERILITHGHIDHYGQAKRLSSLSGAPIYIHSKEYGRIRSFIHSLGFIKSILLRNGAPETLVNEAIHYMESAQIMADSLDEAFFLDDGDSILFKSMTWKTLPLSRPQSWSDLFSLAGEKNFIYRGSPLKRNHPQSDLKRQRK